MRPPETAPVKTRAASLLRDGVRIAALVVVLVAVAVGIHLGLGRL